MTLLSANEKKLLKIIGAYERGTVEALLRDLVEEKPEQEREEFKRSVEVFREYIGWPPAEALLRDLVEKKPEQEREKFKRYVETFRKYIGCPPVTSISLAHPLAKRGSFK